MSIREFHKSASVALLRTLLFCINLVFMISGGILVLLGITLRYQFKDFIGLTPEINTASPYFIIGLGLFIFFVGLLAFWCTAKGHVTFLYIYSMTILLILVVEVLLAVTVMIRKQTYEDAFKTGIIRVMNHYPHKPLTRQIDRLQKTLQCCGILSYKDWFGTPFANGSLLVPPSCCKISLNTTCVRKDLFDGNHATDINQHGCYEKITLFIQKNYPVFGGIILAMALFPLAAVILSCCLAHHMGKHRYEKVA